MALFVGLLVLLIVGALAASTYLSPRNRDFPSNASAYSFQGFVLSLSLNSTRLAPGSSVAVEASINSTSPYILNLTARESWPLDKRALLACDHGQPLGAGVVRGFYTEFNYSSAPRLLSVALAMFCPPLVGLPADYFLLQPGSSSAVASSKGTAHHEDLQSTLVLTAGAGVGADKLTPGVYTIIAADEWGDLAIVHLRIS